MTVTDSTSWTTLLLRHQLSAASAPRNQAQSPSNGAILGQRRRRWPNIAPMLGACDPSRGWRPLPPTGRGVSLCNRSRTDKGDQPLKKFGVTEGSGSVPGTRDPRCHRGNTWISTINLTSGIIYEWCIYQKEQQDKSYFYV